MKLLTLIPKFSHIQVARSKGSFSTHQLRDGCVTVFYFWSKDCVKCTGMPNFFSELQTLYGERVACVAIHDGEINSRDMPHIAGDVVSLVDNDKRMSEQFGVRYYPAIFVFDQQQLLRFQQMGASSTRMLSKRIGKFVEED